MVERDDPHPPTSQEDTLLLFNDSVKPMINPVLVISLFLSFPSHLIVNHTSFVLPPPSSHSLTLIIFPLDRSRIHFSYIMQSRKTVLTNKQNQVAVMKN